jgi:hypothetical protein
MATRRRDPRRGPSPQDAAILQRAIYALVDYAHVAVQAGRWHLHILVDGGEAVARYTPLGGGRYGLSFHSHTGRWEPMPIMGDLVHLAQDLVTTIGPYLHRLDFPDTKSGSDHLAALRPPRRTADDNLGHVASVLRKEAAAGETDLELSVMSIGPSQRRRCHVDCQELSK